MIKFPSGGSTIQDSQSALQGGMTLHVQLPVSHSSTAALCSLRNWDLQFWQRHWISWGLRHNHVPTRQTHITPSWIWCGPFSILVFASWNSGYDLMLCSLLTLRTGCSFGWQTQKGWKEMMLNHHQLCKKWALPLFLFFYYGCCNSTRGGGQIEPDPSPWHVPSNLIEIRATNRHPVKDQPTRIIRCGEL